MTRPSSIGNTLLPAEIKEVNRRLPALHWKDALRRLEGASPDRRARLFENRRVGYPYLMFGGRSRTRALEVGAGTGIVSAVLAEYFENVIALDSDEEWVRFLHHRFSQDGLLNVQVARARLARPPFRAGTFALIVSRGTLARREFSAPGLTTPEAHRSFLRRCCELLEPGGRICLATENRFHLNFFWRRTPHGDGPLTTLTPRPVARGISRLPGFHLRPSPIYSKPGLRRLFDGLGFDRLQMFVALPSYANPVVVLPVSSGRIGHEALESWGNVPRGLVRGGVFSLLSRTGLLDHVLHSFIVTAVKRA